MSNAKSLQRIPENQLRDGLVVDVQVRILSVKERKSDLGHTYSECVLGNALGEVVAVVPEMVCARVGGVYPNLILEFEGLFRRNPQRLHIQRLTPIDPVEIEIGALFPVSWAMPGFENDVHQLVSVLDRVRERCLRSFVVTLFLRPDITRAFLRHAGSHLYHHNYGGGLLRHTVEVLNYIDSASDVALSEWECQIALVIGLVHDLGKTVTIAFPNTISERGRSQSHEMAALELMAEPLVMLERYSECAANYIRSYFTPRNMYPYRDNVLLNLVRKADSPSASR